MYDFGPLAAQSDPNLLNYFHRTKQVNRLVNSEKAPKNFIFVTRPGGGKTSLVKWLEGGDVPISLIFIRPTEFQLVASDDDLNPREYQIMIGVELFTGAILEIRKRKLVTGELLTECNKFLLEDGWGGLKNFFKNEFEGIEILGYGLTLNRADRRNYLLEIKRSKKFDKALSLLRKIAPHLRLAIVLDDPESLVGKGLDELTQENAIRIGTLMSVLNDLHGTGIQVMLFVKEHIIQIVQANYLDSSHFKDRIEGLEWTDADLIKVLSLRVSKRLSMKWDEVFEIQESYFINNVFPYLINGPRDLIYICNSAGEYETKIKKENLQKGIDTLHTEAWGDIKKQYPQWPSIDVFARTITAILIKNFGGKEFSPKEANSIIDNEFTSNPDILLLRNKEDWIDTSKWASPGILERLFLIGCLGFVFEGAIYYPWAGRSLVKFRSAKAIFVNPLFLGSRQKRVGSSKKPVGKNKIV